ncbi:MAG TPA: hypothetical protein VF661_13740 [Actinomycetales bacterium]|jgi:hypothetical protein
MRQHLPSRACAAALVALTLLGGCAVADPAAGPPPTQPSSSEPTTATSVPAPSAATPTTSPSSSTPSGATSASSSAAPTAPQPRTLTVTVEGRTVTPAPAVVPLARGEVLRLVVTTDRDDELHAHGFEVEQDLVAGEPTTVELSSQEPGRYEVETHEPALRLMVVQVR